MIVPQNKLIGEKEVTFLDFVAGILNDPKWGESYQTLEANNTIRCLLNDKKPGDEVNLPNQTKTYLKAVIDAPTHKYNLQAGLLLLDWFRLLYQ